MTCGLVTFSPCGWKFNSYIIISMTKRLNSFCVLLKWPSTIPSSGTWLRANGASSHSINQPQSLKSNHKKIPNHFCSSSGWPLSSSLIGVIPSKSNASQISHFSWPAGKAVSPAPLTSLRIMPPQSSSKSKHVIGHFAVPFTAALLPFRRSHFLPHLASTAGLGWT